MLHTNGCQIQLIIVLVNENDHFHHEYLVHVYVNLVCDYYPFRVDDG